MNKEIIKIPYPFILINSDYDELEKVWRPGTRYWTEMYPDCFDGETFNECDSIGYMIITKIGAFKPDGHQERVFYKRHWELPNGELKGLNSALKVLTLKAFEKLTHGYKYEYEINSSDKKNGTYKK